MFKRLLKKKVSLPISSSFKKKLKVFIIVFLVSALFTSGTELYRFSVLIEPKAQETKKPDYKEEPSQPDIGEVALDYELMDQRDPYTKHFRKIDGTYEMSFYNEVVHYLENGKYQEIDNTLVYDELLNDYVNKANDYKLKLPKRIDNSKKFKLKYEDYEINWNFIGINESEIEVQPQLEESQDLRVVENLHQSVLYPSVYDGVPLW